MASNIGSTATITGNPQNIMIGSFSRIPYAEFAAALAPVAAIGLVVVTLLILLIHHREFLTGERLSQAAVRVRWNGWLLVKSLVVTLTAVVLFFAGQPPAKVAITAGALLLLTRRLKPERVYREIDWSLLLLFAGLFIVVRGMEKPPSCRRSSWPRPRAFTSTSRPMLAAVAAILSNLVSNVPAVLVLKPFVQGLADPHRAWLVLAMASTLAGNFTILGSVANLIVVERARRQNIEISFWSYFRIGAPLTLITIVDRRADAGLNSRAGCSLALSTVMVGVGRPSTSLPPLIR